MSTIKDFRYSVQASRLPRRRVRLTGTGKPALEAATPPEFRGGTPGMWSPEDLLVASVASCYSLTLDAIAKQRDIPIHGLSVEGVGHVTRRAEGRIGFVVIELLVELAVEPGFEEAARRVAHSAKRSCLVGHALEIPIELELCVRSDAAPTVAQLAHAGSLG
jgi:organic hydroperoxide reductase OsmC/OhrA